jgi:hypothetical protein
MVQVAECLAYMHEALTRFNPQDYRLTPVMLATGEAEIRRTAVRDQPR